MSPHPIFVHDYVWRTLWHEVHSSCSGYGRVKRASTSITHVNLQKTRQMLDVDSWRSRIHESTSNIWILNTRLYLAHSSCSGYRLINSHCTRHYAQDSSRTVYGLINLWWLRLVGSLELQVSFAEHSLFYRALLQKKSIILRSLLIVATPYPEHSSHSPRRSDPIYLDLQIRRSFRPLFGLMGSPFT